MGVFQQMRERLSLLGTLDPQSVASTETYTDYVDMSKQDQALVLAMLGDMAAETIDVTVYEAKDGSGTGEQSLKSATQLAAHATNNDNEQIKINVRSDELSDGYTHIRVGLVTGDTTGGPVSIAVLGGDARYEPASQDDLASVVESVE
jgi:hypothetical protein